MEKNEEMENKVYTPDTVVKVSDIRWVEGKDKPTEVEYKLKDLVFRYDGNPNRVFNLYHLVDRRLENDFCEAPGGFTLPEEFDFLGWIPNGLHVVVCTWRNDQEDEEKYAFGSKKEAVEFVRGYILKMASVFDRDNPEKPKTDIDIEATLSKLFSNGDNGYAECVYCQTEEWFECWLYKKEDYPPMC